MADTAHRDVHRDPRRDRHRSGHGHPRGEGRPFLLLHGGAGSQSVDGFAALLSTARPARVLTPLHPAFGGTPRPDGLNTIRDWPGSTFS